jgi:predicted HicB family RNase H-like nuclease
MAMKERHVTVRVSEVTYQRFATIAQGEEVSVGQLIRKAMKNYLAAYDEKRKRVVKPAHD